MRLEWRDVDLPDFEVPIDLPTIPARLYEERCRRAYRAAECDWLVVYGDREHYANLAYLINVDPRFEEALLLVGQEERKYLLVGNEGLSYAAMAGLDIEVVLAQSFSLMGQDRTRAPRVSDVLRGIGVGPGHSIGLVGWKYLESAEADEPIRSSFVPAFLVDGLRAIAGAEATRDVTSVLMHPSDGLRATVEADQIAAFEWGAARATMAVLRVLRGAEPQMTELEAARKMEYSGEPLTAHVLFASGKEEIIGLRSPTSRRMQSGDGVTVAIGYWGGLGCRAGILAKEGNDFLTKIAVPYYSGIVAWYESVRLGVSGAAVHDAVGGALAVGGLRSTLNSGHLTGHDEWIHSPVSRGSEQLFHSGMALQCDIIPGPLPPGWVANCEDPLVLADQELQNQLREGHPEIATRIDRRRQFMREQLGIKIAPEVLPLSTMPAYFPPFWLSPSTVLAAD